jgi:uncharacterized protein (TIGR03066 family)
MIRSRFLCLLGIGVILTVAHQLLFGQTVSAAPAPRAYRILIIGVWEVTKSDDGTPPKTTIEFTRDGKLKVKTKSGDETLTIEGTYKLDGNKLTLTIKAPEEEEGQLTDTLTIIKLTDKVLITKDEKGKTDEFKRKR